MNGQQEKKRIRIPRISAELHWSVVCVVKFQNRFRVYLMWQFCGFFSFDVFFPLNELKRCKFHADFFLSFDLSNSIFFCCNHFKSKRSLEKSTSFETLSKKCKNICSLSSLKRSVTLARVRKAEKSSKYTLKRESTSIWKSNGYRGLIGTLIKTKRKHSGRNVELK